VVFYSYDFTVPKNTPETSPVEADLRVTSGIVTRLDILFPPGCAGVVRCAVFWREDQLVPRAPSDWIRGHNERVETRPFWPAPDEETILTVKGWSESTRWDHTLLIRIEVLPPEIAYPYRPIKDLADLLKKALLLGGVEHEL